MKALSFLAPDLRSDDPVVAEQTMLSLACTLVIGLTSIVVAAAWLASPSRLLLAAWAGTGVASAILFVSLRARSRASAYLVCGVGFGVISVALYLRGGLTAPASTALGVVPLMALCYWGRRAALWWTAAVALEILAYGTLVLVGVELVDHVHGPLATFTRAFSPLITILVFVALIVTYDRIRRSAVEARDLAERDRLRAEAESAMLRADRMASIGQLAAGVAHEVNNPLSYVIGNLAFLDKQLRRSDVTVAELGDVQTALDDASEGAQRVKRIVADLRAFSRREEESIQAVDLRPVIRTAIKMAESQFKHRARVNAELDAVPLVMADEGRLLQVTLNLLMNAAQAMPDRPRRENLIEVRLLSSSDGAVSLEVSDNGVGIPKEHLDEVFTPFFTTKSPAEGTGLGLSVCRSIVRTYGGQMTLESAVDEGTVARMTLSAAPSEARAERRRKHASVDDFDSRRVLVIDDDDRVRAAIKRTLRGNVVVPVGTAEEALEMLARDCEFDVIVCDLVMPGMGGQALYEAVQQRHPQLLERVVFLTGGAFSLESSRFMEALPNVCLDKPYSPSELRKIVAQT